MHQSLLLTMCVRLIKYMLVVISEYVFIIPILSFAIPNVFSHNVSHLCCTV